MMSPRVSLSNGDFDLPEVVKSLAPLWCSFDASGVVIGYSEVFFRTIPEVKDGVHLTDLFLVERPDSLEKLIEIQDQRYLVFLQETTSGNRYKGTKFNSIGNAKNLLVISPVLNETNSPTEFRLELSDFPVHDNIAEYLFVMKTNRLAIDEAAHLLSVQAQTLKQLEESKAFYERILNEIPVDIAVFDQEHRYVFVNKTAIQDPLLRDRIIGQDDFEYAQSMGRPSTTAQVRRKQFNEVKNHRTSTEWTQILTDKNGEEKNILRRMIPIENNLTELEYVMGYGLDVTSLKNKEAEVESISRFPLENPHIVIRVNFVGEILFANQPARESPLIQESKDTSRLAETLRSLVQKVIESHNPVTKTTTIDGKVFSITAVNVEGRNYVNIYSVDITESKIELEKRQRELEQARADLMTLNELLEKRADKSEQTLEIAKSELEAGEKMALLGKVAAGVAHEMNTPLGAIVSSTENLSHILQSMFKEGLKDADHNTVLQACNLASGFTANQTLTSREERKERKHLEELIKSEYGIEKEALEHAIMLIESGVTSENTDVIDHIYSSQNVRVALEMTTTVMRIRKSLTTIDLAAQKAAKVVSALKSYVRNENVDSIEVFDISRSINDVLVLFGSQIRRGVELHLDISDGLLMQGNETELSKVWANLIANALYALNEIGNLWITAQNDEKNITITVSNDGPPIPDEVMARLFEPFYTTKPVGEGTGLGLSMVFNIVASLNGSIEVETGDRTTFTVNLPQTTIQ